MSYILELLEGRRPKIRAFQANRFRDLTTHVANPAHLSFPASRANALVLSPHAVP